MLETDPSLKVYQTWYPFDKRIKLYGPAKDTFTSIVKILEFEESFESAAESCIQSFVMVYSDNSGEDAWTLEEFNQIFEEAKLLSSDFEDNRYVKKGVPKAGACEHGTAACCCYLKVTIDCGIPTLIINDGSAARKARIELMHRYIAQFLMHLAAAGDKLLEASERELLTTALTWVNPEHTDESILKSSFFDKDTYRRARFLALDSSFERLRHGNLDVTVGQRPEAKVLLGLCGILGRRLLALTICRSGAGYLFLKKQHLQYWDFTELMENYGEDFDEKSNILPNGADDCFESSPQRAEERLLVPHRVINTETLEIESDPLLFRKSYAIFSHTWGTDEVEYSELKDSLKLAREFRASNGNRTYEPSVMKLIGVLEVAFKLNYPYIWIDNCLIDKYAVEKKNQGEISEAISCMGPWYQNAIICLIYLADFDGTNIKDYSAQKTRWATRGWTLQEVAMSPRALFFNKKWVQIADTADQPSRITLSKICHVPPNLLCCGGPPPAAASIIMQLASNRNTFKPEDRAYSLMGMLGVRMSIDYGEGSATAIARLVHTVLNSTGDVSIFNWAGQFSQARGRGRSMYTADFAAYAHVHLTALPAISRSPIRLDHVGIHANFDICEIATVNVEGDNKMALRVVSQLERSAAGGEGAAPRNAEAGFTVFLSFHDGARLTVKILYPVSSLRRFLQNYVRGEDFAAARNSWVMARFAGVKGADWFLAEIFNEGLKTESIFAEACRNTVLDKDGGGEHGGADFATGSIMKYLENSGFEARRIAAGPMVQSKIPEDGKYVKHAYMWVG